MAEVSHNSSHKAADVDFTSGKNRLAVDAVVTVEEVFGKDPFPDSYFTIVTAGAIGSTIRLQVAATTGDTTSPDRDVPAVDLTYTLIAADVGDELKLRDNLIAFFNTQSGFTNAFLKAQVAKDIAVVHITSTKRSMGSEFYERPASGDFAVSTTGATTVTLGHDNLLSRGKSTSLARDPDSPHRLGILGISGSVNFLPGEISNRFQTDAFNGGNNDITVDADPTIQDFLINSITGFDLIFTELRFHFRGGSFKFGQFLNMNSPLANGILVEVKSDDITFTFDVIKSTDDLKARWSSVQAFDQDVQAAGDHVLATKDFGSTAIVIRRSGSFSVNDYIKVRIRDDITAVSSGFFTAIGFKRP